MNGGLMYYGYVRAEQFRQAAVYVDRILKGAKPAPLSPTPLLAGGCACRGGGWGA